MNKLALVGLGLVLSVGLAGAALSAEKPAEKSVTGTLEDSFCYGTMGAMGPSHKKCATECAKKGIPVALVEKGSGKIFMLLPPKNAQPIPDDVISKMEDEVTVTGKEYAKGGVVFLTVESVK
jgi:hypothetical protein